MQQTLERDDVQCWVLDNASQDDTYLYLHNLSASWLSAATQPFRLLRSSENVGVAGGRAELLKCVEGEIAVFLDSDVTIIDHGWLDKLGKALEPENIGLVGPGGSMILPDWSNFTAAMPNSECDCVAGYCMAFRRELLDYGLHMEADRYPGFWTEDSSFCLQVRDLGYDVMCVPVGIMHSPSHSGLGQDEELHKKHLALFREQWRGKGLVKAEGGY